MEFKPVFEEPTEKRRRRRRRSSNPRLVDEDGTVSEITAKDDEDDSEPSDVTEPHEVEGPGWHGWVFALVPMLIIMFGAGREPWSKGVAALLMAAVVILFPVRRKVPTFLQFCLLGLALAPGSAFLPAAIHGVVEWREKLAEINISVPSTITPQTWVTLEAWFAHGLCVLWLAWAVGRGFSYAQRRSMLRVFASGGVILASLSIMEHLGWLTVPWWPRNPVEWGRAFGPFANRNHISSLAAITCVLCAATAYDAHRRKHQCWIFFAVGFFVPLSALFVNSSRAGLLLLFLGMTMWLGTSAMRRGFFKKMAVAASLVFLAVAVLFMSNGGLASRVDSKNLDQLVEVGGRETIYRDAIALSGAAPWTGIGLGNFDTIFSFATDWFAPSTRALHPESDLLWYLTEAGLLLVVPGLFGVLWVMRSTGPWFSSKSMGRAHRQDRRLRNTAAIVLGLGLVHGIVDVPIHQIGYAAVLALLAGITIRPRRLPKASSIFDKAVVAAGGVAAVLVGCLWLAVGFGRPILAGSSSAALLRSEAREMTDSGSLADALPLLDRAIQLRPLDYALYFERAQVRLRLGDRQDDVLEDFTRARVLEPHYSFMCYQEGLDWLPYRPEYAILGWRECLKRNLEGGPGYYSYWGDMLQQAAPYPELRRQLWGLAKASKVKSFELQFDYLRSIEDRDDFALCLRELLDRSPDLSALDGPQRMQFFGMWNRMGDREALMASILTNKQWQLDGGWKLLAEYEAQKSNFKSACDLAKIYLPSLLRTTPGVRLDLPALERAFLFNVMDARVGVELFQAYKATGDVDRALSTLEKVKNATSPPNYIFQEMAALYVQKEDYRHAWEQYREAINRMN